MNPYQKLLDDPVRLNADEHTAECLTGMGIPWSSDNPGERNGLGRDERKALFPQRTERRKEHGQ